MEPSEEVKDLGALLDAGEHAVVTLVAGDTRLVAHRAVLTTRSPEFAAKFKKDTPESSSGQLVIADVQGPVLRQLLAYLYTSQIPQVPSMALQLLAAADSYSLAFLKTRCEQQVTALLDVENAASVAILAVRHSCHNLRQAAIAFLKAHTLQVMATEGWADAVRAHPDDLVEVSRLLSELPAEASTSSVPESSTLEPSEEAKAVTASNLGDLLDAREGAMVTVVAGDTHLVAHRAVLAARSPEFAKFHRDMLEATNGTLVISDIEGPVLRQLLAYLYTLQVPNVPALVNHLLPPANKYDLAVLKAHCEQQLTDQLAVENAAATAVISVKNSCYNLRQAAINFIQAHTHEVMATEGWANEVRKHPEYVVEVSRLLSELPREASAPAIADSRVISATQMRSDHGPTLASSAHPVASSDTAAVSQNPDCACSGLGAVDHGSSPATQSHCDVSKTPTSSASPTAALPDVSDLRSLSKKERGTRLIEAAKVGAMQAVQALLLTDVDVGATDWTRWTALHHAAATGHVDVASHLLTAGAQVDAQDIYRQTPLHCAALNGHVAVVQLLVAASANPNIKDVNERTPLHLAAYYGHSEVAKALLGAGADKEAKDEDGRTPLDIVRQYNRQQLIDMLK